MRPQVHGLKSWLEKFKQWGTKKHWLLFDRLNSLIIRLLKGNQLTNRQREELVRRLSERLKQEGYTHLIIGGIPLYVDPLEKGIQKLLLPAHKLGGSRVVFKGSNSIFSSSTMAHMPTFLGAQSVRNQYIYNHASSLTGKVITGTKGDVGTWVNLLTDPKNKALYIKTIPRIKTDVEAAVLAHEIGHNINTTYAPTIRALRVLNTFEETRPTVLDNKVNKTLLTYLFGPVPLEEGLASYNAWKLVREPLGTKPIIKTLLPAWFTYSVELVKPRSLYPTLP